MKLFNKIKVSYKKNITYQGVSKIVKQLLDEGILQKQGKEYQLNTEWIDTVKQFGHELTENYSKGRSNLIDKNTTETSFFSFGEWVNFLFDNLNTDFFEIGKNKKLVIQVKNITPVPISASQLSKIRRCAKENQLYLAVSSNTVIDRILAKFIRMTGFKVKLGVDCAHDAVIICSENCLVRCYLPYEIRKEELAIYKEAKSLENKKVIKLLNKGMDRKVKIHMTITRNKELATKILDQSLDFFER